MRGITTKKLQNFFLFLLPVCIYFLIPNYGMNANLTSETTFFLVRHAEKVQDGSKDPILTTEGTRRADELRNILKHVQLHAIYSTPYKRTQQTVLPTAEDKNLKIQNYKPGEPGFLDSVLSSHPGGTVLIVGHSNTIPGLANELAGQKLYDDLNDATYDNLFIAHVNSNGDTNIIRMRYGAHPPEK